MMDSDGTMAVAVRALRQAILNGADCGWASTVEQLVGLQDEDVAGAFLSIDDDYLPRALTLTLPVAQHLFRLLDLTPYGCIHPAHDAVYGRAGEKDDGQRGAGRHG